MSPEPGDALSRSGAKEVLRYWLASLRLEEALSLRPRARRVARDASPPRLDEPSPGQEYFKVPLDDAAARMLLGESPWSAALDAERSAFVEDWLYRQYRRADDEGSLSHLFCFPVVHLPRGELAGLLRAEVRVQLSSGGASFRVPTWAERRVGTYPAPPDELAVCRAEHEPATWPFFLDTRLLGNPLGVSADDIDALFDTLRARPSLSPLEMLSRVAEVLEKTLGAPGSSESASQAMPAMLDRLRRAMQALLARSTKGAKVYPVGIVLDATRAKTTWHLQRELSALVEGASWSEVLERYVEGSARRTRREDTSPQRALYDAPPLTERQRQAADYAWEAPLGAVQGPPGTGKTTLILHLAAEALVRQVEELADRQRMGAELFLVASSNNRAVDNVLDPLGGTGLPLALRVGSRLACAGPSAATLRRALAWLAIARAEPEALHRGALEEALTRFREVRGAIDARLAPEREARAHAKERGRLERQLAQVMAGGPITEAPPGASRKRATQRLRAIDELMQRTTALSRRCEGKPNAARLADVARYHAKTVEPALGRLEQWSGALGLGFEWPLPPRPPSLDVEELTEAWEDAAELALTHLGELRASVEAELALVRRARKVRGLQKRLAALGEPRVAPVWWGEREPLSRALFAAAVDVREAWARAHAAELSVALEAALRCAVELRSLRPLFRQDPEAATLSCQLFGIWGSTLLSLGNCLPPSPGSIARVVIDEAGQCHPAHAVSALLRSQSALVIGDVHQLTPVIELGVDDDERLLRSCGRELEVRALAPYRLHRESTTSAQALAERAVTERHSLVDHFRCDPAIIAVSDALCGYGLDVHTKASVDQTGLLAHPVSLLDVRGVQEPRLGSWYNELELRETLLLLDRLLAVGRAPSEIAIITPYRAQLELLRRGLAERGVPLEASPELVDADDGPRLGAVGLALGTVHRFQGGERNVVLFTSVATRVRSLGFLNDRPNLLNVAISRARHRFVCIGDRRTLACGARTRLLVEAATPLPAGLGVD